MTETQYTVIEWSPGGVRAYDPVSRQTVTDKSVAGALARLGRPATVGLCLSRKCAFVRESRLPDVEKSQARAVLGLKIDDMFPAVKDGVSFDFVIGRHRYDDGMLTTVCAVSTGLLDQATKEVEEAGAKVAWTSPVSYGSVSIAEPDVDAYIVVELEGEDLCFDVVRHGSLVFSRSVIDPGSEEGRKNELLRTLAACGVSNAVAYAVQGTDFGGGVQGIAESPLRVLAQHDPAVLNVMTPEAASKIAKAGASAQNRLAMYLWLLTMAVGVFVWDSRTEAADRTTALIQKEQKKRTREEDRLKVAESALKTIESKMGRVNLAFAPAQPTSDVLKVVSQAIPNDAWLTGITLERGKLMQIRGAAMHDASVGAFTEALATDPRFRDVKLLFSNNAEIESVPVVQFSVTAHVVGNLPLDDKDIKNGGAR